MRDSRRRYQPGPIMSGHLPPAAAPAGPRQRPARPNPPPAAAPARSAQRPASDAIEIGIGPPVRTADRNASTSAAWPLSRPFGIRELAHFFREYTDARTKSSNFSTLPSAVRSRVSFGKPDEPVSAYVMTAV